MPSWRTKMEAIDAVVVFILILLLLGKTCTIPYEFDGVKHSITIGNKK